MVIKGGIPAPEYIPTIRNKPTKGFGNWEEYQHLQLRRVLSTNAIILW